MVVLVASVEALFPSVFGSTTISIAKPFWKTREFVAQAVFNKNLFSTKASIVEENNKLTEENNDLRNRMNELEILRADNASFREALALSSQFVFSTHAVLVHPSQTPYDTFVIDGAPREVGSKVVSGTTALGIVSEAGEGFMKVDLYSSSNKETEGRLLPGGEPLILRGHGAGNFSVRVPRDFPIAPGALVVLPGDPAFALARVGSVEESEKDSFKHIRLITPLNIFTLRWVEILNIK